MICIIALIVFAILAVFSARYRPLAAEAFDCVFRRVTFRKCHSGLDRRLKGQITGTIMKRNKKAGRFIYKYFEVFSWFFLLLLILSMVQVGISTYNVAVYGNCNGLDDDGFCIFDPLANGQKEEISVCSDGSQPAGRETLVAPNLFELAGNPRTGSSVADVTVIEFGCFSCPNTAEQAPAVKKLIEHFGTKIQFVYLDFPLHNHAYAQEASLAAQCVHDQNAMTYWYYHFLLFQEHESLSSENLRLWAEGLGVDMDAFDTCLASDEVRASLENDVLLAEEIGIYGTPTFFINDEPIVGVKSYRFLKAKINKALEANS